MTNTHPLPNPHIFGVLIQFMLSSKHVGTGDGTSVFSLIERDFSKIMDLQEELSKKLKGESEVVPTIDVSEVDAYYLRLEKIYDLWVAKDYAGASEATARHVEKSEFLLSALT